MYNTNLFAALLSTLLLNACTSTTPATHSALGSHHKPSPHKSVWIAKDLELNQCEQRSAQDALDRAQQQLRQNQIATSSAYCANDGMMRVQLCGAPQGKLGLYKIKQTKLAQAQALGFKPVHAREYPPVACQ